jgi:hypothetical protein
LIPQLVCLIVDPFIPKTYENIDVACSWLSFSFCLWARIFQFDFSFLCSLRSQNVLRDEGEALNG